MGNHGESWRIMGNHIHLFLGNHIYSYSLENHIHMGVIFMENHGESRGIMGDHGES